jgi:hypothetical protein
MHALCCCMQPVLAGCAVGLLKETNAAHCRCCIAYAFPVRLVRD